MLIETDDVTGIFDDLGATGTYTPHGGSATTVQVMVASSLEVATAEGIAVVSGRHVVSIQLSEVAAPARDASVVVASGAYAGTYQLDELLDAAPLVQRWYARKVA